MLDQATLKEWVRYDPETGIFTRIKVGRPCHARHLGPILAETCHGYICFRVLTTTYRAHVLAWLYMTGELPASSIDHINRKRADNRWCNLRLASRTQQNANMSPRKRRSKTGVRGVYESRPGYWIAALAETPGARPRKLGHFRSIEEAKAAYETAARARWGEAYLNMWDLRETA